MKTIYIQTVEGYRQIIFCNNEEEAWEKAFNALSTHAAFPLMIYTPEKKSYDRLMILERWWKKKNRDESNSPEKIEPKHINQDEDEYDIRFARLEPEKQKRILMKAVERLPRFLQERFYKIQFLEENIEEVPTIYPLLKEYRDEILKAEGDDLG